MSACARDQILKPGKWPFRLTGSEAAQRRKTGVDFTANRPAMRPLDAVGRQQAGIGHDLVEVFGDRQRVPDRSPVMPQAGAPGSTTTTAGFPPRRGVIGSGDDLLEFRPQRFCKQPAAQRTTDE